MDPLSQGLLGAAAAMSLQHRSLGRGAAAVGALAGILADVDIFGSLFLGPVEAMVYHRHVTHSLLFIPIGGLLAALPFFFVKAWRLRRKEIFTAALLAYATHPLLDACTAYGTPLLWPITSQRFAFDVIAIIDPIFTLLLLLAVVAGVWREKAVIINVGLVCAGAYLALGLVQHERGMAAQKQLIEVRGHLPQRQRVMPTLGNLVVWRSVYESNGRIFVDGLRLGVEPAVLQGDSARKASLDHLGNVKDNASVARSFDRFVWFSDGFVGRIERDGQVMAGDLRYSLQLGSVTPIWAFAVEGSGDSATATIVEPKEDRKAALRQLWGHLWRGDAFGPVPTLPTEVFEPDDGHFERSRDELKLR